MNRLFRPFAAIGLALACAFVQAQQTSYDLDIPAQALSQVLSSLSKETGLQPFYAEQSVKGVHSPGVKGRFGLREALNRALAGTGLSYEFTAEKAVAIKAAAPKPQEARKAPPAAAIESTAATPEAGAAATPTGLPEILVTGSSILNLDIVRTEDDVQSYTVIDSQTIKESGAIDLEDFLRQQLSSDTQTYTQRQEPGLTSGNTSLINLRGLGPNETLILIDGRRAASPLGNYQTDINGIPLSAIERIEVLSGPGSAIYGGAALGGVVNIILKKNFHGGEFNFTYGNSTMSSVPENKVSATYGFSLPDDATHVMVSGSYASQRALTIGDRADLFNKQIGAYLARAPGALYGPGVPFGNGAATNIASLDGSNLVLLSGTNLGSPFTYVPSGSAPGSNLTAGLLANAGQNDLTLSPLTNGASSVLIEPVVQKSLMLSLRRPIDARLDVYADLSTATNYAYTDTIGVYNSLTVPAGAPTNPFQQAVQVAFPTSTNLPTGSSSITQRISVGAVYQLPADWVSSLDYTWSSNRLDAYYGYLDYGALANAFQTGAINPFVDTVAYPLDLSSYKVLGGIATTTSLDDINFRIAGTPVHLPWGDPTLTLGLEYRKEGYSKDFSWNNDLPVPSSSFTSNTGGLATTTDSVYAETLIPLVTGKNSLPLLSGLDVQLAWRGEHYDENTGAATTLTAPGTPTTVVPPSSPPFTAGYWASSATEGLRWKPWKALTIRASHATAFLPPTAAQLLPNPIPSYADGPIVDPTNGSSYVVGVISGGNRHLQPQRAQNWNYGLIFEPAEGALEGLRLNVERYRIVQPNYIAAPSPQQVVDTPGLQSRVVRDANGLIQTVDISFLNLTRYETAGWDFKWRYQHQTPYGLLGLDGSATRITYDRRQYAIDAPVLDYAGFAGFADNGEVELKGAMTFYLERPAWRLAWTAIYVSSYFMSYSPNSPTAVQYGGPDPVYRQVEGSWSVPHQLTHNLSATYRFDHPGIKGISTVDLNLNIRNVFNTPPAFDISGGLDSSVPYSPLGDPLMRYVQLGVRAAF